MAIDPKYELLPESFEKRGRVFTLIQRTDAAALYRVRVCAADVFEVWRRKFNDATTANMPGGVIVNYTPKEVSPPDTAFGKWAWTYNRLETALNKFREIDGGAELPLLGKEA